MRVILKKIVESTNFKTFLNENNLLFVKAIDATGNGNLLPKNITPFINNLLELGVDKIFVLTDLDEDRCITKTKERISAPLDIIVVIAVKQIETWFLADSITLSTIFKENF